MRAAVAAWNYQRFRAGSEFKGGKQGKRRQERRNESREFAKWIRGRDKDVKIGARMCTTCVCETLARL